MTLWRLCVPLMAWRGGDEGHEVTVVKKADHVEIWPELLLDFFVV